MNENRKKVAKRTRLGRKAKSSKFIVVPVFKKPLDLNKIGHAIVLLAANLAEEKNADPKNNLGKTDCSNYKKPDVGGSHEKSV